MPEFAKKAILHGAALTVVTVAAAVAVGLAGRQSEGEIGSASRPVDADFTTSGPWDARLLVDGEDTCGATIIGPRWMITAARCVRHPGAEIDVVFDSEDQATVASVREHPSADLALVRLDQDVAGPYAPLGAERPLAGGRVRTYGWSMSCEGDEAECKADLQAASSTLVTAESCGSGATICVDRDEGCASEDDFGRPLFAPGPDGRWYLIGLSGDCVPSPAYADLTRYRDWIKQITDI
ncbi:Trypsin [Amycolatopsis xylanica]|uniref:Trypsin n=1 Tax=Amycolatopsis xylanica TaxID=589385 RepID=A0A1H3CUE5_9PSEU|nr:trypsin-like serine protease [Amycolatopsis xylanica]SDX57164.1 Trypsin [Amycolatopsis xylanica]